jgi:hypothetical protein
MLAIQTIRRLEMLAALQMHGTLAAAAAALALLAHHLLEVSLVRVAME